MNLSAASGLLPISNRLDRSPTLNYLPKRAKARWWRPRVTMRGFFRARWLRRSDGGR